MKDHHIYKLSSIINEFNETCIKERSSRKYLNGYYVTSEAPNTYKELKAYKHCKDLPVYSGGSEYTIYEYAYQNYNGRFVHDLYHIDLDVDFSFKGEWTAIRAHYLKLKKWALKVKGRRCLRLRKLFLIDTILQVMYYYDNKSYLDNQMQFVLSSWNEFSLDALESLMEVEHD